MILETKDHVVTDDEREIWWHSTGPEKRAWDYMAQLCEEVRHMGWDENLEFSAWRWITKGFDEIERDHLEESGVLAECEVELKKLKEVMDGQDWWPYFPPALNGDGYKLPLDEWKKLYHSFVRSDGYA